jgi:hypothetical protein
MPYVGTGFSHRWLDVGSQVNTDRFLLVRLCVPNRRRKVKDQLFLKIPACSLQKFGVNLREQAEPSNTKVEPIIRCDNRDRVASTCDRNHGRCDRTILGAGRLDHLAHQVTEGRIKNRFEYLLEVRMVERVPAPDAFNLVAGADQFLPADWKIPNIFMGSRAARAVAVSFGLEGLNAILVDRQRQPCPRRFQR